MEQIDKLRLRSNEALTRVTQVYQREEIRLLEEAPRLFGLKGARGVGKTTLLLQHLNIRHGLNEEAIYLSLDDIVFTETRLIDVVEQLHRLGLTHLYLDEVHKYTHWALEVKNLYDRFPDLRIIFTGSSMLELVKGNADLSRRAIVKPLQGLSFRQFLALKHQVSLPRASLEQVLREPNQLIGQFPKGFKPYRYLREYWQTGYYPFFLEGEQWYFERLEQTVQAVVETDIPYVHRMDPFHVRKLYALLHAIATSPPFKPNVTKLGARIELSRAAVTKYLTYLHEADILMALRSTRRGISAMQKPEKLYLENPNLVFTYQPASPDPGTIREIFVMNQLKAKHSVRYAVQGDFYVDDRYTLEVGGRSKSAKQIAGLKHAYIVADGIDFALGNKIPLFLFGLLY